MFGQQGAKGAKGGGGSQMLIMFLLIIVVFYFFMIRPQQKKAKDLKKFREALKRGDKVVTIGGIHGKIVEVGNTTVVIDTGNNNNIKLEKSAVATQYTGEELGQNK